MGGNIATLQLDGHRPTVIRRTLSLLLPVFLLAALMIMVADRADASTAGAGVAAAAVSTGGASAGVGAIDFEFDISSIVCPILLFVRAAFGPFFGGIFDSLLGAFGCTSQPSGVTPPPDDGDEDAEDDDGEVDDEDGEVADGED